MFGFGGAIYWILLVYVGFITQFCCSEYLLQGLASVRDFLVHVSSMLSLQPTLRGWGCDIYGPCFPRSTTRTIKPQLGTLITSGSDKNYLEETPSSPNCRIATFPFSWYRCMLWAQKLSNSGFSYNFFRWRPTEGFVK